MKVRYTNKARWVIDRAKTIAKFYNHPCVHSGHMLIALCEIGLGVGAHVIKECGIDLRELKKKQERRLKKEEVDTSIPIRIPTSVDWKDMMRKSIEQATELGHDRIGTEHLLLGLLALGMDSGTNWDFIGYRIRYEKAKGMVISILGKGIKVPA